MGHTSAVHFCTSFFYREMLTQFLIHGAWKKSSGNSRSVISSPFTSPRFISVWTLKKKKDIFSVALIIIVFTKINSHANTLASIFRQISFSHRHLISCPAHQSSRSVRRRRRATHLLQQCRSRVHDLSKRRAFVGAFLPTGNHQVTPRTTYVWK